MGMGKHGPRSSDCSERRETSQPARSGLSKVFFRGRASRAPPQAQRAEGLTSELEPPPEKKPAGGRNRVPAVTSKARTTAPEKDKSRRNRRKYPSSMRQRPH